MECNIYWETIKVCISWTEMISMAKYKLSDECSKDYFIACVEASQRSVLSGIVFRLQRRFNRMLRQLKHQHICGVRYIFRRGLHGA
jgi:hypothetical protein